MHYAKVNLVSLLRPVIFSALLLALSACIDSGPASNRRADGDSPAPQTTAEYEAFKLRIEEASGVPVMKELAERIRGGEQAAASALAGYIRATDGLKGCNAAVALRNSKVIASLSEATVTNVVVPALIAGLRGDDRGLRRCCAITMTHFVPWGAPAIEALLEIIRDPIERPNAGVFALETIAKMGTHAIKVLPELHKEIETIPNATEDDRRWRGDLAGTVGAVVASTGQRVDLLERYLSNQEPYVRIAAVKALGSMQRLDSNAWTVVSALLDQKDENVLYALLLALTDIKDIPDKVRLEILGLAKHADPALRETAADIVSR